MPSMHLPLVYKRNHQLVRETHQQHIYKTANPNDTCTPFGVPRGAEGRARLVIPVDQDAQFLRLRILRRAQRIADLLLQPPARTCRHSPSLPMTCAMSAIAAYA